MRLLRSDAEGLAAAVETLMSGGIAVIPTDTVYGLAAHPAFPSAVERLYSVKGRDLRKPIALLASDAAGAAKFVGSKAAALGDRYWPGALTVVAHGEGVRVPDHRWTRELIAACGGALRVTSANMSGRRPAADAEDALASVGLSADLVVDDGMSAGGVASTVVRIDDSGRLDVLREGPVEFLVLASSSPRRAAILSRLGVDFAVVKSDAEEVAFADDPERTVRENALAKGRAVKGRRVLSADTIVWFGNRIYGKPKDVAEAKEFLRTLGGNTHQVFTGVAYNGEVKVCRSDVTFRPLSDEVIDEYVARVNPLDRAGAYDIDELGGELLVKSYSGSYENIVGLPVEPLVEWGVVKEARKPQ